MPFPNSSLRKCAILYILTTPSHTEVRHDFCIHYYFNINLI